MFQTRVLMQLQKPTPTFKQRSFHAIRIWQKKFPNPSRHRYHKVKNNEHVICENMSPFGSDVISKIVFLNEHGCNFFWEMSKMLKISWELRLQQTKCLLVANFPWHTCKRFTSIQWQRNVVHVFYCFSWKWLDINFISSLA